MEQALQSLTDQVRAAHAHHTPLHITGSGSKAFMAPPSGAAPLDLRPYHGIVAYEPTELVVTVRAGTRLADLEAALAEQRQYLPFEPPHYGSDGTVGGMVAAGLSGPARASVGAVRDYVLGVRMLNGLGQDLRFGGQVMKNVAGYDVSRLMAGSWGQLGAITEVSLKVLPLPPAQATLRFAYSQAQALERLQAWGGQPLPLNASCWVHDAGVDTLFVRLRGASAAVEAACRTLGGERMDNAATDGDWRACRDQRLPWFASAGAAQGLDLWRLSVPAAAPVLGLPADLAPPLIEWHGALRWVWAGAEHAHTLHSAARQAGGNAMLFRASGAVSADAMTQFDSIPEPLRKLHARVRQAFDPAGIFHPGTWAA